MPEIILEAALISAALSIDVFATGFAYGANKIKIPLTAVVIINLVSSLILCLALFSGAFIGQYISHKITLAISVILLIILGVVKLFSNSNVKLNKILSLKEAVTLAVALSLDGLTVGIGAGLVTQSFKAYIITALFSFITGLVFIIVGKFLGDKLAQKTSINLSWLSGVILIVFAVLKLF